MNRATTGFARVESVVVRVLLAMLPGLLLHAVLIDLTLLVRLGLLAATCAATDAVFALARHRPPLRELSSLVTAVVLALALPPTLPLVLVAVAGVVAIAIGRHALDGLNPAMLAYATIAVFAPALMYAPAPDAHSGATLLGAMSTALEQQQTLDEVLAATPEGSTLTAFLVALAWLGGGAWLIRRRLLPWRIPAGVLLSLCACALLPWMLDGDRHASPLTHLIHGSAVFAAFFVATDPGSSPRQDRARLRYGLGIGVLLYAVRSWGDYADGIAFAVLLMNFLAPMLDRSTADRREGLR